MTWLLYGANGYTGTLVARLAAASQRPVPGSAEAATRRSATSPA
jgi:short subunit dehydrogenase-like uncharacterized protein